MYFDTTSDVKVLNLSITEGKKHDFFLGGEYSHL